MPMVLIKLNKHFVQKCTGLFTTVAFFHTMCHYLETSVLEAWKSQEDVPTESQSTKN